jgi:hypothetical protein
MAGQQKGGFAGALKGRRKRERKAERKAEGRAELIEVFLAEPGEGRPPFTHEPGALGDILLFPRKVTGDTKAQTFAWGGTVAPFVVVEREHLYFRDKAEKFSHIKPSPARYVRTVILVRRLTDEEYAADPGQIRAMMFAAAGS